jgi:hypothetical protein
MDWADSGEQAEFRKEVREFIEAKLPEYYKRRRQKPAVSLEENWEQDYP